jgi:hypothetical protein
MQKIPPLKKSGSGASVDEALLGKGMINPRIITTSDDEKNDEDSDD